MRNTRAWQPAFSLRKDGKVEVFFTVPSGNFHPKTPRLRTAGAWSLVWRRRPSGPDPTPALWWPSPPPTLGPPRALAGTGCAPHQPSFGLCVAVFSIFLWGDFSEGRASPSAGEGVQPLHPIVCLPAAVGTFSPFKTIWCSRNFLQNSTAH